MNNQLQHLFAKLETQRAHMFEKVAALSHEQWHYHQPNKWSIAQILTHIMVAEKLSLLYMKKKSLGMAGLPRTGIREDVLMIILKISQRLPFRFKAPAVVEQNTPQPLSYDDLKQQWDVLRADLQQFLSGIHDNDIKKKIYKHAFAGRLNVMQAMQFLFEHGNHHWPQIKRLLL